MRIKMDMEHPVIRILNRFADLLILNFIFVFSCLPVLTVGAAWTALYSVTLRMMRGEEPYIIRSYFKAMKDNMRQATLLWLFVLFMGIVLWLDFQSGTRDKTVTRILLGIVCIFGVIINIYAFPLMARFENTIKNILSNALLVEIQHFPVTLAVLAITVLPPVITFLSNTLTYYGIPFWGFLGFSLTAYANSWFFHRIFEQYEIKD